MRFNRFTRAALVTALLSPMLSFAAAGDVDVTAATAKIDGTNAGVLAIGLSVFGVAISIKLYKWLRSAL